MSSASIKKIIPCKKEQLVEMVLDIEKYPEFVPWCLNGKVHTRKESSDLVEIKADLKVGKSIINETYTSLVHYYKEKDKILVTNIEGPLTLLKNEWKFKEINNSTQLEFDIDFELKNNLLNAIMKKSFNFGLSKIADAFEKRALELILTGKTFTALEAKNWGLVNEVFDGDQLMIEVTKIAKKIAKNAPLAVKQAKNSIKKGLNMSLSDGLFFEIECYNRTIPTKDRLEGILAFNEKRPPKFKGH